MTSIAGLLVWLSILITYVRFHRGAKLQGIDRRALPYFAPCQPYLSYYGLFMIVVILFFAKFTVFIDGQWDTADFVTTYLVRRRRRAASRALRPAFTTHTALSHCAQPIILFPICYVGVYCHKRCGKGDWGSS